MNTSESFKALRKANPRTKPGFAESVEATADAVREQLVTTAAADVARDVGAPRPGSGRFQPRRALVGVSAAGVSLAAVAAVVAFLTVGSPRGPGVESATAAVQKAANVTAASAEHSGTAVVQISHNSEIRAGTTVRWHDRDVAVSRDAPLRPGMSGAAFLVVDGILYSADPADGGWFVLGRPESIDSGSGATPHEQLAAVREDIDGVTLRRIIDGMTGLTTSRLDDGSTVYRGTVPAGLIASESESKEGRPISVLPFGYVAQDEAADPSAPLDVAITVGPDGIVREDVVQWGAGGSVWTYTVRYSRLGATSAPLAPTNARPLRDRSPAGKPRAGAGSSE